MCNRLLPWCRGQLLTLLQQAANLCNPQTYSHLLTWLLLLPPQDKHSALAAADTPCSTRCSYLKWMWRPLQQAELDSAEATVLRRAASDD